MKVQTAEIRPRLSGAAWAARAERYASLISEHLSPQTKWLDAGCGWRLLENDLDPLEDWLVAHCRLIVGMDVSVEKHRNINLLVRGSLYQLPFADNSLDLVTCNMVVEHLENPREAFAEVARCLKPRGAFIVLTPNLLNYGIMGNAIASRVVPEKWRLRLIYGTDERQPEDFFPVRYKANTMRSLVHLLVASGFEIHRQKALQQQQPFFRKIKRLRSVHQPLERLFMRLNQPSGLLVCAHRSG